MSNTLKLGNGKWATGKDTLLSFSDTNNNYKPLPFSFSRASSGTVINKDGLIETVGSGEPRIDFKDNTKGALLLEPSRSNDLQRSQEFDDNYWTKYQTSVLSNSSISPDGGLNADRLIEDNSNSTHQLGKAISYTIGTTYTVSIFAKSSDRNLEVSAGNTNTFPVKAVFDLKNGIVLSETFGSAAIQKFNNGWYRCVITASALATSTTNINFGLANGSTLSYNGNGVSFIELFGAMREQGSYATSYIPTSGSAVTRIGETCSQTVPDGVIGQTEGTLFVETTKWVQSNNGRILSISDGTTSNYITIIQNTTFSNYAIYIASGGVTQVAYTETQAIPDNSKIAISYKQNDFTISVNGQIVHTDTSGVVPSTSKIYLGSRENGSTTYYSSNPIKVARIYNTRLSNSELAALTS